MDTTQKLTEWAINKIKTEYPEDVALLVALSCHNVNGDGHGECFDYFIPATDKGYELTQAFIIGGIGHDLYPRSWERVENTANLVDPYPLCLGEARIVYSRTEEDRQRFYNLQQKLRENLKTPGFVYEKALQKLDEAMNLYRNMMFEEAPYKVRMAAGYIAHGLTMAVTYLNGTYIKELGDKQFGEFLKLPQTPEGFFESYRDLLAARSKKELQSLSHKMICAFRRFLLKFRPETGPEQVQKDFTGLAEWYQELSLHWRRLHYYCDGGKAFDAFSEACGLQDELLIVGREYGLPELDLLGCFDPQRLDLLRGRGNVLEQLVIGAIQAHGVQIRSYHTLEAFLSAN